MEQNIKKTLSGNISRRK